MFEAIGLRFNSDTENNKTRCSSRRGTDAYPLHTRFLWDYKRISYT